ncbi:unnamed protein product [Phyllotreta striolata]|uniref:Coiled-coil domain-containing protein 170 n=1 Tax=Phyllotreta striolata TaxID=444603 RepID=A0A9N9TPS6_PHYSR|nr:unnamed protein product [Phyllotreta striolata]
MTDGNSESDWEIFKVLCKGNEMDHGDDLDLATTLRSEIAALQFTRDRLQNELDEMRSTMALRDQRCLELKVEADQLREQVARQNSTLSSLRKRICDLEERERNLLISQTRYEATVESAQKDIRYSEEKNLELDSKIRRLEFEVNSSEQKRDALKIQFQDFVRRLSIALGADFADCAHVSLEMLIQKASELIQETARLKNQALGMRETINSMESDLKASRDNFERCLAEKECFQRQSTAQNFDIDKLRQEKETAEIENRVIERELNELRNKFALSSRNLDNASENIIQQENLISKIRDEVKSKDEKLQRLAIDHKHALETIAIVLSTPSRYVDSSETTIKDRIHEILHENNEKTAELERLREKLSSESQQMSRQSSLYDQAAAKIRCLEDEKNRLEMMLRKADADINSCDITREALTRDKTIMLNFLDRLAKALNMDEISNDVGVDLQTETLLLRAEQLARLENEKLADKLLCCGYGTIPRLCRIRRERTFHDLPLCNTSMVYQLQRRIRNLREQVQRKDLHLDLLRRKLTIQEDNNRVKCMLQNERDEANERIKKLIKQNDRLQLQLSEAKTQIRNLNSQLAEATDFKIMSLERGRKIEDLQKRLIESESLRNKYNRKISLLKEQVRTTGETIDTERNINEQSMQFLRDELAKFKHNLSDAQRKEAQLHNFKQSIAKILGVSSLIPDYELISRLQKLVDAHHDFTLVSKRYDDPVLRLASRSPTGGSRCTRTPDRSRYDDSGYIDGVDIDV